MRTQVTKPFNYAFSLTEQELRRICDIAVQQMKRAIKTNEPTTIFRLKFKNDFEAEHNTIEEVISENNGGIWEIQSLTIEMYEGEKSYSSSINLKIKFSSDKAFVFGSFVRGPIELEIEGEDRDWVYLTTSQLEDRLKNIKIFTLTNLVSRLGPRLIVPFLVIVFSFLLIVLPAYGVFFGFSNSSTKPLIPLSSIPPVDIIISIVFLILVIIGLFTGIYFFPSYNFSWGSYLLTLQKKHAAGKFIITVVIIGILISIVTGVLSNYIFNSINIH